MEKNERTRCVSASPLGFRYRHGRRFGAAAQRGKLIQKVAQAPHLNKVHNVIGLRFNDENIENDHSQFGLVHGVWGKSSNKSPDE